MNQNPYQSPDNASDTAPAWSNPNPPPAYELYSPQQIALASFFGGPIAGAWFLARNYWNLGNSRAETLALSCGLVGTASLFAVWFYLPIKFANIVLLIIYAIGLFYFAKDVQGRTVEGHLAAGGKLGSSWRVAGSYC